MTIKVGDTIPAIKTFIMGEKGPQGVTTEALFANKKVVVFAVPGAYTPTCSVAHLPGYVVNADAIKAKGVDSIICLSVNDPFVMDSWGKELNAEELVMLSDGNAELSIAMGLDFDGSGVGLGQRSQRYSMVVDNMVVTHLALEEAGKFEVSGAEDILKAL